MATGLSMVLPGGLDLRSGRVHVSTWIYQINPQLWPPQRYRLEIWEGERWAWQVGRKVTGGHKPEPGDIVAFFHTPGRGGGDPGFYGWAIILEWFRDGEEVYFRPVAPSDHLKMDPWWSLEARALADEIRGKVKQGTMWYVPDTLAKRLREGIVKWLGGRRTGE